MSNIKTAITFLNVLLFGLAFYVAYTLIHRGDAWVFITTYWCVTVIKNGLQLWKEGA